MRLDRIVLAAVAALAVTAPATAQNEVCYSPGQYQAVDVNATNAYREMVARQDPQLMRAMAGVWYAEIPAPQLGMTNYQYRQYDANGLFQYQDQTCTDGTSFCSKNGGHGYFTATSAADGSMLVFLIVSDLSRNQQCSTFSARLVDNMTMQDSGGGIWRRVQ